jgi:hypothetical protein
MDGKHGSHQPLDTRGVMSQLGSLIATMPADGFDQNWTRSFELLLTDGEYGLNLPQQGEPRPVRLPHSTTSPSCCTRLCFPLAVCTASSPAQVVPRTSPQRWENPSLVHSRTGHGRRRC